MAHLGSLTIQLLVDTKALAEASAAMQVFSKQTISKYNAMAQRIRTVGYLTSAVVTAPMILAGKEAFNMAKDYEYAMQKIVGLTGIAQGTVNEWSKDLLSMSKEFGRAPQEMAEALYYISSSGIKGAEALDVLRLSAKAAASGLGETQDVANFLTSVLNAYAGTGVTASYATDVLVAAVREGKAEAQGFAAAMGSLIPIASQMGVSIDQVAGAMAAITLTGSSAAQSAVYLKGILNGLLKESGKGAKALDDLKTSYSDLRRILREEGLIALMQKLRDLQAEYGETLASKVFPNIRSLSGFLAIAGKNFKYNTEIMKEVTAATGSLNEAWKAVSDTIKVRYDRAIARIQVSTITFGRTLAKSFLPILEWLAKKFEALIKWFDSLTEAQKRNKIMWALMVAVIGPVSLVLSSLIYTVTGLMSAVNGLAKAFGILNLIMKVSPIGRLIAVVGSLAGAFINFRNKVKDANQEMTEFQSILEEQERLGKDKSQFTDQMRMLYALNPRQKENLKVALDQQLAIYEDFGTKLRKEREDWFTRDEGYLSMQKTLESWQKELDRWNKINTVEAHEQRKIWQRDVDEQRKRINDYVAFRESYLDNMIKKNNKDIEEMKKYSKTVSESIKYDPVIKAQQDAEKLLQRTLATQEIFSDLESQLGMIDYLAKAYKILGVEYDIVGEKIKAYDEALKKVAEMGLPMTIEGVQKLMKEFETLARASDLEVWKEKVTKIVADVQKEIRQAKVDIEFSANIPQDLQPFNTLTKDALDYQKVINDLSNAFDNFFYNVGGGFKNMLNSMLNSLLRFAAKLAVLGAIYGILQLLFPASKAAVGALSALRSAIGMKGFANGTNYAPGGLAWVGEQGPELVNLPRGAKVTPTNKLSSLQRADSWQKEVVFRFNGTEMVGVLKNTGRRVGSYS